MATLYVDRREAVVGYRDGAAEIRAPGGPPTHVPLRGLERIVVVGNADLSAGLLGQCWSAGVGLLVLSGRRGEPTARMVGGYHKDAAVRVEQCVASRDARAVAAFARRIVFAKLAMQARVLRRLGESRPGGRARVAPALSAIANARERLRGEPDLDVDAVRGLEGAVAAAYFGVLTGFFPPSLGFTGRRRRPPPDPVNAALSLGYTLATFEAGRQAQIAGLDPAVGALHALGHGRDSLALDLVEPARPLVDAWVQGLFRDRTVTADHFASAPGGGMILGKAGRRHFFAAWESRSPALSRFLRLAAREAVRALRARIAEPAG